jgi:hypothetical protein
VDGHARFGDRAAIEPKVALVSPRGRRTIGAPSRSHHQDMVVAVLSIHPDAPQASEGTIRMVSWKIGFAFNSSLHGWRFEQVLMSAGFVANGPDDAPP